jgi:hypothetical protein
LHQQADDSNVIPSSTSITGSLAFDVVLPRDSTAGLGTMVSWRKFTSDTGPTHNTTYVVSGRLGHAFSLWPFASFWPVVSIGLERGPQYPADGTATSLIADLDLPVVCHPSPHFFVGAGPTLNATMGGQFDTVNLFGHIVFGGVLGS